MLNILFDSTIFEHALNSVSSKTGIYWTAKNILNCLLNRKDINIFLYLPYRIISHKNAILDLLDIKMINVVSENDDLSDIDVFFSPLMKGLEVAQKYPKMSCYTILYDITPELFPEYFLDYNQEHWFKKLLHSLNPNDYYFAISEHTKQDFLKYFPIIDNDKIETISLSTNIQYKPCKETKRVQEIYKKYNIPNDKKYLFSLCSLEPRKNLIRAVKTFLSFIKRNNINDLVYILGGQAWDGFIEKLEREVPDIEEYKDKIIRAGYIEDKDLEILYSNAEWFIYTSQYEGFGMPPLEAMSCGCPVITSNNSSLPEVVGNAALMIDWDNDEQHIAAYEKYYFNKEYREQMGQKGLERAKMFSWEKTVDSILKKMNEVEQKKSQTPLVTIITATYNLLLNSRKNWFIQNLESVRNQTYNNIEHIIIDGASTDGTLDLLEEYQQKGWIKYYSEPDKGIYDALNKGILKSNGKYVVCLNSDDFYNDNHAVEWLVSKAEENDADACYGDAVRIEPYTQKTISYWGGENNLYPMLGYAPCHQTFLIRTDVMKDLGFYNPEYIVSADNIFILKMYTHHKRFVSINKNIISFRDGGFSNSHLHISAKDHEEGIYKEFGIPNLLTKADTYNLYANRFLLLPCNDAIELGAKLARYGDKRLISEYYRRLLDYYSDPQRLLDKECSEDIIKKMCQKVLKYFLQRLKCFSQQIFSMVNEQNNEVKIKIITILGAKFKIKKNKTIGNK